MVGLPQMLILFLCVNDSARMALITLGSLIVVTLHALDAVRNINAAYGELAANYHARGGFLFRTVRLPACLPQVFTGSRLALGRALVTAISVDRVSSSNAFGSSRWMAWETFATHRLFVGVFMMAAPGASLHSCTQRLEHKVVPWRAQHAA